MFYDTETKLASDGIRMLVSLLEFCKKQYCQENIYFLLDIEKLKNLQNNKEATNLCRRIYKKYIVEDSEMELNLPYKMRNEIKKTSMNGDNYDIKMFDNAVKHIEHILKTDTIPKFNRE